VTAATLAAYLAIFGWFGVTILFCLFLVAVIARILNRDLR